MRWSAEFHLLTMALLLFLSGSFSCSNNGLWRRLQTASSHISFKEGECAYVFGERAAAPPRVWPVFPFILFLVCCQIPGDSEPDTLGDELLSAHQYCHSPPGSRLHLSLPAPHLLFANMHWLQHNSSILAWVTGKYVLSLKRWVGIDLNIPCAASLLASLLPPLPFRYQTDI